MKRKVLFLYVPVLHQGYIKLLEKYSGEVDALFIMGINFIKEFMPLHEEIRALDPEFVAQVINGLGIFKWVSVLNDDHTLYPSQNFVITADEAISRAFIKKYFQEGEVIFERVFLRWDEKSVLSSDPAGYDCKISRSDLDKEIIGKTLEKSKESADWWRQVGGALVRDGDIISIACNNHVPHELMPYVYGDPRDFIKAGQLSEVATAFHCEQALIADAARKGMNLEGASLYITVFPCPMCAKLIAFSGIKKIFFASGHASLDGEKILKLKGVKLIFVDMS